MSRSSPSPSPHLIARADIVLDASQPLGQGGFGVVHKATRKGGSRVAAKQLLPGMTAQSKADFQKEVGIMCSMGSEFVVQVYGIVDDSPHQPVLIIMELMHESLHDAYSSVPPPLLRQRVVWLLQAAKGIAFLHAAGVIHRDIKPSNMLLSSPDTGRRLKMGDFGLSKSLADITASITSRTSRSSVMAAAGGAAAAAAVGTVHYMAPELMSMKPKYSPASDVYAFGVVCWETICMRLPYRHCVDQQDIKKDVRDGMREDFELEDRPDFVFPPALKSMIERAWAQDPKQRPSIDECVRDLEQFLEQLAPDAPEDTIVGLGVSGSMHSGGGGGVGGGGGRAQQSPPPLLDSRMPAPIVGSRTPPNLPRGIPSVNFDFGSHIAALEEMDIALFVEGAGPNFAAKGYGQAVLEKKVSGAFISKANELELTALFMQLGVDALDSPTLREAFLRMKSHPEDAVAMIQRAKFQKANAMREAATKLLQQKGVIHDGYHYMTLGEHDPASWHVVDERYRRRALVAGYEVCPDSPAARYVCAQHNWAAHALVLADGSFCMTKLGPNINSTLEPGRRVGHDGLSRHGGHSAEISINYPMDFVTAIAVANRNGCNTIGDGCVWSRDESGTGIVGYGGSKFNGVSVGFQEIENEHHGRAEHYVPNAFALDPASGVFITALRSGYSRQPPGSFPSLSFDILVRSSLDAALRLQPESPRRLLENAYHGWERRLPNGARTARETSHTVGRWVLLQNNRSVMFMISHYEVFDRRAVLAQLT